MGVSAQCYGPQKKQKSRTEKVEASYQRNDGTLRSELSRTEQRPDKPIDLLLLRVVSVVVQRHLRLLFEEEEEEDRVKRHNHCIDTLQEKLKIMCTINVRNVCGKCEKRNR